MHAPRFARRNAAVSRTGARAAARSQRAQQRLQSRRQLGPQLGRQLGRQNAPAAAGRALRNAARQTASAGAARFATRFAARSGGDPRSRGAALAAREAWSSGRTAGFVAWYGPLFWPYAYSDIFDYAFWPDGYAQDYWSTAYDHLFDGFWEAAPAPRAYRQRRQAPVSYAAARQLCAEPTGGITAWPFQSIPTAVNLNADQMRLLDALKTASQRAAETFAAACPPENAFPQTPLGRLQAITARLQATLAAVRVVKPPLEQFYNSLSTEQKESFNRLGPRFGNSDKVAATGSAATTGAATTDGAAPREAPDACAEAKPGLTTLPIGRIEKAARPTVAQEAALKQLEHAADRAVKRLQQACPDGIARTPPERLDMMAQRLQAMADAAWIIKTPLERFYDSLNDRQKARVNHLGRGR